MAWTVEWDERAIREARKLDPQARKNIISYLRERIKTLAALESLCLLICRGSGAIASVTTGFCAA
ncbi:MAG: type II toxin-antitoxin system RelE family toxin [Armatimonadota bacterium]